MNRLLWIEGEWAVIKMKKNDGKPLSVLCLSSRPLSIFLPQVSSSARSSSTPLGKKKAFGVSSILCWMGEPTVDTAKRNRVRINGGGDHFLIGYCHGGFGFLICWWKRVHTNLLYQHLINLDGARLKSRLLTLFAVFPVSNFCFLQLARSHRITMVRLREWWQDRLFLFLFICSSALFVVETVSTTSSAGDSSCNVYSSLDTDDFWVSVGRCAPCIQSTGCGFCQSTLQCMNGTASGPSNGFPCPTWTYSLEQCPALPHCETFSNCGSCATQDQCAWCASEGNPPLIFF